MCGILGIWDKTPTEKARLEKLTGLMAHRGPDARGYYQKENWSLAHLRLSIIDLKTGAQPMLTRDRKLAIVFNGEIYNYRELRDELQKLGQTFNTQSDTEVLLNGYRQWGTALFSKLNGIFAFILADLLKKEWILVRDPFGVKPLHYFHQNGLFIAASEQKPILAHPQVKRDVNWQVFHDVLNHRYSPGKDTLFAGIHRLPPAHFAILKDGKLNLHRYWEPRYEIDIQMDEQSAIEGFHLHLKQAVQRQLVSDVPLGVYLSGGMDSSAIVQKMHELNVSRIETFTLGFNEPSDEFPDAELVASHFGTSHHTLNLAMEPLQTFPETIWYAEEPKINLLQGFNMSAFVKPHVTVALGGLGGDELMGGYDIHRLLYPLAKINPYIPQWLQKIGDFKSNLLFQLHSRWGAMKHDEYNRALQILTHLGNIEKQYLILRNVWDMDDGQWNKVYNPLFMNQIEDKLSGSRRHFSPLFEKVSSLNALDQVFFTELQTKMVNDYLLVDDRMSMSHGVEERVPFLDVDLVNFANTIPIHLKMKGGQTKYLFRKAMEGYLPEKIIRKKKWGFAVNPYLQFKKDLKHVAEHILTKEAVEREGIFNYTYIRRILDAEAHPKLRWHYNLLWMMSGLMIWKKMFIDSEHYLSPKHTLEDYYE